MHGKNGKMISRRRVLAGIGGVSLALPWLEKFNGRVAHAAAGDGPKRVIVMAFEMGLPTAAFKPSAAGSNYTLPYVAAPLEPFKDRLAIVTGLDNKVLKTGGQNFIYGHDGKKESALTGTLTTGAFPSANGNKVSEVRSDGAPEGGANGPSLEHLIGQHLRNGQPLSSIDLGVDGDARNRAPELSRPSHFFFEGPGNAVSLELQPRTVAEKLFADVTGQPAMGDPAIRALRLRKKSVLDAVRASFTDLQQGLGTEDRRRLSDHADRIRQVELDVVAPASCSPPELGSEAYLGMKMDKLASMQNRVMAHAMACDLAPIGRIEYTNQQNPRFGIAELDSTLDAAGAATGYDWHAMVHGDPLPNSTAYLRPGRGTDTTYDQRLLDGYHFFVKQFADLLTQLDSISEGADTTVLDNTLVILASDFGEGLAHAHYGMNYVLAGNLGSAKAGHVDGAPLRSTDESRFNVNQLLNGVLDMAGVVDGNGQPVTMGLAGYLEGLQLSRRIEEMFG
jgi:hypothetical protein